MRQGMGDKHERKRALEEAGNWVMCLEEPDVSSEDLERWYTWMQASPEHARAFDDISLLWESSSRLSSDTLMRARAARGEGGHGRDAMSRKETARRAWRRGRSRREHGRFWRGMAVSVAALMLVAVGIFIGQRQFSRMTATQTASQQHHVTGIGERRQVTLADGTVVDMGAATEIMVRYTSERRWVDLLRGRAYFSVEHDGAHPFEVRAGGATIRDLGTRFEVGYTGDVVSVTVQDGLVRMHAPKERHALDLVAGDQASLDPEHGLSEPRRVNVHDTLSWLDGMMVYRREPLGHVIADMNRYSHKLIELGDPAMKKLAVTGRWRTADVSVWVRNLAKALSLTVRYTPDRILLVPKSGHAGMGDEHAVSQKGNGAPDNEDG